MITYDLYRKCFSINLFSHRINSSQDAEHENCDFNAPAIRKEFLSKFDKYNILAL